MSNKERKLLRNAIICPDGKLIESRTVHDFVQHVQEDGREYAVDGGLEYQRILYSDMKFKDISLYSDDTHEVTREKFHWGTYGKNGDQPLKHIPLKEMEEEHILNIINNNFTSGIYLNFLKEELKYRNKVKL